MPLLIAVLALAAWEAVVRVREIPPYVIPAPSLVLSTLISDWPTLWPALLVTLKITLLAFALATVLGVVIALLFVQSPLIEASLFPYAILLQVTPVVAIAPLIIIWVKDTYLALLICAWIVAFFPVLSNATLGLSSTDHNLLNLFQLYGASRRQTLWYLRVPSAMPLVGSSEAALQITIGSAPIIATPSKSVAGLKPAFG